MKNKEIIFEYLYCVEEYITFHIEAHSGKFSGETNFCINKNILDKHINELMAMYNDLKGNCEIFDYDSDDYLKFEISKDGHLKINIQLGGTHNDNYVVMELNTDQTVLNDIIKKFQQFAMYF